MVTKDFIIFDLESTGLDPHEHEILEIAALRMRPDLSTEIGVFEQKVLPTHIETAMPKALEVNGYSAERWHDAVPLARALKDFCAFASGGVLAAYNITFDWSFLAEALHREGVEATFDYHRFDIFSVVYDYALRRGYSGHIDLASMSRHFSMPEPPKPHRAMMDVRAALAVWRATRKSQ